VPIALIELIVLVVAHFDYPIFSSKGVPVVIAHFMVVDFDGPIFQVFTIEKLNPFFFFGFGIG
jgi:hypothetical protein